ncbi:MAG: hypothetical protein Kow0047_19290 [Anaerolineae bacterium]
MTSERCLSHRTRVAIQDGRWHINGQITYPGAPAAGLLMNVRMVNATFEDARKPEFDPEANTRRFIERLPDYVTCGVRAFTLNLQGGYPGYEGAVNSAFAPDGSLREPYLRRVAQVIEACDELGAAVILGCFYQRQAHILRDAEAIRTAVIHAARWVQKNGFTNVLLEIANEFNHPGFNHPLLRSPEGQVELIRLARASAPGLLISTSGVGDGRVPDVVARAADFILIHFNNTPVEAIPECIAALRPFGKPIVCNEDDKVGTEGARAAEACVASGASWGFMAAQVNQYIPFAFEGPEDDPMVYATLRELTSASSARR